jgi:hypothetical protein
MCDLFDIEGTERPRLAALAASYRRRFPDIKIDVENELAMYFSF